MSKTVTVRNYMLSTDVGIMNAVEDNKGNWAPVGGGKARGSSRLPRQAS
jgi:hypothetical protein